VGELIDGLLALGQPVNESKAAAGSERGGNLGKLLECLQLHSRASMQ